MCLEQDCSVIVAMWESGAVGLLTQSGMVSIAEGGLYLQMYAARAWGESLARVWRKANTCQLN